MAGVPSPRTKTSRPAPIATRGLSRDNERCLEIHGTDLLSSLVSFYQDPSGPEKMHLAMAPRTDDPRAPLLGPARTLVYSSVASHTLPRRSSRHRGIAPASSCPLPGHRRVPRHACAIFTCSSTYLLSLSHLAVLLDCCRMCVCVWAARVRTNSRVLCCVHVERVHSPVTVPVTVPRPWPLELCVCTCVYNTYICLFVAVIIRFVS